MAERVIDRAAATSSGPIRLLDGPRFREIIADANDGIIATAGVVEGLLGAGVETSVVLVAGLAAMCAGGISVGAARFAEAALERDAISEIVTEERRRLDLSPDEELAELVAYYEARGVSAETARAVARELTHADAVAAHTQADHGIDLNAPSIRPIAAAFAAGVAFALGAAVVVIVSAVAAPSWRVPSTLVAVTVSLALTSIAAGRWGRVPFARTLARTVVIGLVAMLVTLGIGSVISV